MGFFKKGETQEPILNEVKEVKPEVNTFNNTVGKTLSLFDANTIKYIIEHFPDISDDIQKGLLNLSNILENSIDHIEDESSELIKEERNFELSQAYRNTSISIYKVAQNIQDYVFFMKDEEEKSKQKAMKEKLDKDDSKKIEEDVEVKKEEIINEKDQQLEIYKDFTGREVKGFVLDDNIVSVDDWNDLLVKTAEVLNKKYKENKYSDKLVKSMKVEEKKSEQNDFRDTVIEMLNEYKIVLSDFKVIVK